MMRGVKPDFPLAFFLLFSETRALKRLLFSSFCGILTMIMFWACPDSVAAQKQRMRQNGGFFIWQKE